MDVLHAQPKLHHLLLIFLFFLLPAACLVNLDGGDWDGIQIALASFFFHAAKADYIALYAFGWQPLTYGILRLVYMVTGSPEVVLFLPAVAGALGITALLAAMARVSRGRIGMAILAGIVLLMPEFLFGSVYMNSTVFGFSLAALAAWLVSPDWISPSNSKLSILRNLLAGLALAAATLCRFDFVLTYPMFLYLLARTRAPGCWRKIAAMGAGGAVVFIAASAVGATTPATLLDLVVNHHEVLSASGQFHRSDAERVLFALIGVNVLVWLVALVLAASWLANAFHFRRWVDILVIGPTAVLMYPILALYTPKYLVPFYSFLALFVAWSLSRPGLVRFVTRPAFAWILGAVVMLACLVPARPALRPPFLRPTMQATYFTDDGPRAFWGYAHALRDQSRREGPPPWLMTLLADPCDLLLVAPYDGWLAGPQSQRILLHLVRNGADASVGPGTFACRVAAARIVVTDPGRAEQNVQRYFTIEQRRPVRMAVPLALTPAQAAVLRLVHQGVTAEHELADRTATNPATLKTILSSLRQRGLLETTEPGRYQLTYDIEQLDALDDRSSLP